METGVLLDIHSSLASPALDAFFRNFTLLGDNKVMAVLCASVAFLLWLRREKALCGILLGLYGAEVVVTQFLKMALARPRPVLWPRIVAAAGGSFPSGHAVGTAACLGFLAWLIGRARPGLRVAAWAGCSAVILAVGFSRLYLGVHWPSDVLGGWLIGGALGGAAILAARRVPVQPHVPGLDPPRS